MFFFSSQIKICFLYLTTASIHIPGIHANAESNYAPLIHPTNVTDWTDSVGIIGNRTRIPLSSSSINNDIVWPENSPYPDISTTTSSKPSLGGPKFSCNGTIFGKNLHVASCLEALSKLPSSDSPVIFGERGQGTWAANLPLRVLSTNGICAVDVSHAKGVLFDEITPSRLKETASVLIDICVKGRPNLGGIVSNIGKNGNLAIRVMPYRPNVYCGEAGTTPPQMDCRILVDEMPVNGTRQVFGPKNDPDPEITVTLPAGYHTGERRCQVTVDTLVPGSGTDAYDWYKLWAAASAVEYMCIHRGRNGMAIKLGEKKTLVLELNDMRFPDKSIKAVPSIAVS